MRILNLILGNVFILYLGTNVRFLYKKYLNREQGVTFKKVYKGPEKLISKSEEIEDFNNEMANRMVGVFTLFAFVIILWLFFL